MTFPLKKTLASFLIAGSLATPCLAQDVFNLKSTIWGDVENKVDPNLLYAIALAESQKRVQDFVRPWPWAVNAKGVGHFFDSLDQAEAFIDKQIAAGNQNMDVGPLQINTRWHGDKVSDPKDLLDLKTSIRVGADILAAALASEPNDPVLAVGHYHNWSDEKRAREYGLKVLKYRDAIEKAEVRK